MLFLVHWEVHPETRNAAQDRFRKTGGLPPAGVKMVGRWHYVDMAGGVALAEADDAVAIAKWAQAWSDVITLEARAVMDDQPAAVVIG